MIHEMHDMLRRARMRLRSVRLSTMLALCWFVWALVGGVLWWRAVHYQWDAVWLAVVAAAIVSAVVCWQFVAARTRDPRWVAHRIEHKFPELGAALLAALELAPVPRTRRLRYLQFAVVREAVHHGRSHNWGHTVTPAQLWSARVANFSALALLVVVCGLLVSRNDAAAISSTLDPTATLQPTKLTNVEIEPGDAEIERGTTLLVVATFPESVPSEAALVLEDVVDENTVAGESESDEENRVRTRSMTRSLDDPKFVGRVASVARDMWYSVEFDEQRSQRFRITVFDYPQLERADARLVYPEFTSLAPKQIDDIRHVTAVEGTELTLTCRLNKDVEEAHLADRDGNVIALARTEGDAPDYAVTWTLKESARYKLHLRDADGRENKLPPEIVVNVQPNRPATIKIARPSRDVRVSPIEELEIAGDLNDDFGVLRYGVTYSIGGEELHDAVLFDSAANDDQSTKKKEQFSHLLDFEALDAEPDELIAYYVWAEDAVDDGARQTLGDMFFAEVRHFEEIFREGEQPTEQQMREQQQQQEQQGQQDNGERAEQLAELQKQIVNATWGLVRRETLSEPPREYASDVGVVQESQQEALRQLEELAGELTDEQSIAFVDEARKNMQSALNELASAAEGPTVKPLRPALSAEQAAYQSLLKLRAREFNVVQGQQQQQQGPTSGSASGPGSRAQRQLEQLELSADENRYETQSRALSDRDQQAAAGQRDEARQFLDRLRELARRQEDLNERLRELQSELQAAETEEEREEIERELKRLRDQQQEILRDADELRSDVENSENRQQMEDTQQQLEEARSRAQQASEALEDGRLSEAITEGTRAGRQLDELRDEFRRRTADRFSEEMREMRSAAEQLDQRQERLSEMLNEQNDRENLSLRDGGAREELMQGLTDQQREYEELMERIQETVQEAEEPEPLLARQLYETAREAMDQNVEEALDVTQQLLDVGITREAAESMQTADRGIDQLREGIDRAAESVLGDETEALRRAERELRELAEELDREIARAQGRDAARDEPSDEEGSPGRRTPGGERPDGPQSGEPQPGPEESDDENEERQQSSGESSSEQPEGDENPDESPTGENARQNQGQNQQPGNRPTDQAEGDGAGRQQQNQPPNDNRQQQQRGGGGGGRLADRDDRGGGGDFEFDGEFDDLWRQLVNTEGPITGEDFRPWSDRLRNVEELLDDPELSAEAARIRDRAEAARAEYKRHSKEPDWTKLTDLVAEPLHELQERIADEIRRQESPDALVPIDRDPIPAEYVESVRRYYQRLGSGE